MSDTPKGDDDRVPVELLNIRDWVLQGMYVD